MNYDLVALGDVCEFLDSKRVPVTESDRTPGPYPYYGANGQQGWIDGYIFDEPLVLLAEDGGSFGSKTKPIAYKIAGKTWVNNHAHVLRPKSNCDVDYLHRILSYYDVTKYVNGTTRQKLTKGNAEDIRIPLPPLPEQRCIADLLSRADRLRRLRRVGGSLNASLLQSVFLEMFGDPVKNGKKLKVEELGNIVGKEKFALVDGPFGSHLKADEYTDSGVRVIRVNNIKPNRFNFDDIRYVSKEKYQTIKRSTVRPKDVVMAKVGNTIGKTCVFPDEIEYAVLTANVCKISFDVKIANPFFMCYQMNFDGIQNQIRSLSGDTAKPMINLPRLRELKLIVPPLPQQE